MPFQFPPISCMLLTPRTLDSSSSSMTPSGWLAPARNCPNAHDGPYLSLSISCDVARVLRTIAFHLYYQYGDMFCHYGVFALHRYNFTQCCVEAPCHFCYLEDSRLYVHDSCCPGNQRHLPTYVGCRRFWYSPLTKYGS